MEGLRKEFLNGQGSDNLSEDDFRARLKEYMERRGSATAAAAAVPIESAPAPPTRIGMSMPSTVPELRGESGHFLTTFPFMGLCEQS